MKSVRHSFPVIWTSSVRRSIRALPTLRIEQAISDVPSLNSATTFFSFEFFSSTLTLVPRRDFGSPKTTL